MNEEDDSSTNSRKKGVIKLTDLLLRTTYEEGGGSLLLYGHKGVGKDFLVKTMLEETEGLNVLHLKPETIVPLSAFNGAFKELGNISSTVSLESVLDSGKIRRDAFVLTTNPYVYLERGFENVGWLSGIGQGNNPEVTLNVEGVDKNVKIYHPDRIDFEISRALNRTTSFVVLDGLEYLINSTSNPNKVKKLVEKLAQRGEGNFFIPVIKGALGKEYSEFEDDVYLIDPSPIQEGDKLKLVQERNTQKVIESYKGQLGKNCILFTFEPKINVEKYLDSTEGVYFISDQKDDFHIDRLSFEIDRLIKRFMQDTKGEGTVIFTNLDKVITNKNMNFSEIYKVFSSIRDFALLYENNLVVHLNPNVFNSREDISFVPDLFSRLFNIENSEKDNPTLSDLYIKFGGEYPGMKEALRMIKMRKPILIYAENIGNLDEASLKMMAYLLDETGDGMSVVATSRDNTLEKLFDDSLEILNFTFDETKTLISNYLVQSGLTNLIDDGMFSKVYEVTKGNPLYTLEILKNFEETGSFKVSENLDDLVKSKLKDFSGVFEKLIYYSYVLEKFDYALLTYMINPNVEYDLFDVDFSVASEDALLFIKKMEELGFLEKFDHEEYAIAPMLKSVLDGNVTSNYKAILHARAAAILSEKYDSLDYHLRALSHLSDLQPNEHSINRMVELVSELSTSSDVTIKKVSLELLTNTTSNAPPLSLDKRLKEDIIESYILLSKMNLSVDINKSLGILEDGASFANKENMRHIGIVHSMAELNHLSGNLDKALTQYKQLANSEDSDKYVRFDSSNGLAKIYLEKGDFALFERYYNQAMAENVGGGIKKDMQDYLIALANINNNPLHSIELFKGLIPSLYGKIGGYSLINLGVTYALTSDENYKNLAEAYLKKSSKSDLPEVRAYAFYNLGVLEKREDYIALSQEILSSYSIKDDVLLADYAMENRSFKPIYK